MVRGVKITTDLPISDSSFNIGRDPLVEQSMNGKGGQKLYGGLYNNISGSFGGALRASMVTYASTMITDNGKKDYTIITNDDNGNGISATDCAITSCEISMKAGDYGRISYNWIGQEYSMTAGAGAGDYSADIGVFSGGSCSAGSVSAFSVKIERPYSADDFIIGTDYFSQSIYQSGDTKVTGTITLAQATAYPGASVSGATFDFDVAGVTIATMILTGIAQNTSSRSLIQKTYNWACGSDDIEFT
jgi:hypothetical protein